MSRLDTLILTAANAAQARGYEAQLTARAQQGRLCGAASWRVVADPGGRRVGSGGSTLWVLHEVARGLLRARPRAATLAELFEQARVMVIHSGGDSRRLVAYTAQGKVFTPLPCTSAGHPATLFDLMLADLAKLPVPTAGQVLLAAGDVLLTFDHAAIDFDRPGVVGVAYPGPAERGSQHGVYVADARGKVTDFLQKPDMAAARAHGAVDPAGRVLIDTGLVSLDPATAARWLAMAGVSLQRGRLVVGPGLLRDLLAGRTPPIDLYEQLLIALPARMKLDTYLAAVGRGADAAHRRRLTHVYRTLRSTPFHVNVLPYCEFFHVGTSRDLLSNVSTLNRTARTYGFANRDRAVVSDRASLEGAFVFNSIVTSPRIRCGSGVLIEASHTSAAMTLPGRNIVVGVPPQVRGTLQLPEGWGVVCLPVRGRRGGADWAVVVFGTEDDFKTTLERGGTFGNRPMRDTLPAHRGAWRRGEDQTLWDARLWRVGTIGQAMRDALQWTASRRTPPRGPRLSMRELLTRVDHARLLRHREEIRRLGELHRLGERLEADPWLPAASVVSSLRGPREAGLVRAQLDTVLARRHDPLMHARVRWLASMVSGDKAAAAARHEAMQHVAAAVTRQVELPHSPRPATILPDQVVWATTPVRIDFAGGWSDTPPICTELGGAVVNAAITLNGQYPVQVIAKLSEGEPVVTLSSIDLGRRVVLRETAEVLRYTDPTDWAALPKAALVLSGIAPGPRRAGQSLRRWLTALGGGLDVTLFSALPKGSGLGTSSVLGAAMLACLGRVLGDPVSIDALIQRTSVLEQMMTTGGGWQDQVGGITPGVKLIRTDAGPLQLPSVHWTGGELERRADVRGRCLLYFTGQKRMAKNILQNVVGRYLARDPAAIDVIRRLKADAQQMKVDLDAGDVRGWAAGVERYWQLKQSLDAGSTNAKIEALLRPVNRYLSARLLPGAGGGGFVFMIARDEDAARKVRRTLDRHPPNAHARFFNFDIDPHGLRVTVL
jgi:fucokinase